MDVITSMNTMYLQFFLIKNFWLILFIIALLIKKEFWSTGVATIVCTMIMAALKIDIPHYFGIVIGIAVLFALFVEPQKFWHSFYSRRYKNLKEQMNTTKEQNV